MNNSPKKWHSNADKTAVDIYKVLDRSFEQTLLRSHSDLLRTTAHLRNMFLNRMKSANITKTVEIGAFEAGFSILCQKQQPEIKSIAFEANPYVYERFKDSVRKEGVDYRHTCVADKSGKITFTVPRDYKGMEKPGDHQFASLLDNVNSENVETYDVKSVKLDNAIDLKSDDRLALWVDVEGATEIVFSGASKALKKTAMIYIEVERLVHWEGQWLDTDVFVFLSKLGFVPIARDYQRVNQYNYIYLNSNLLDVHQYTPSIMRYFNNE